jgi:hypothetical protein
MAKKIKEKMRNGNYTASNNSSLRLCTTSSTFISGVSVNLYASVVLFERSDSLKAIRLSFESNMKFFC